MDTALAVLTMKLEIDKVLETYLKQIQSYNNTKEQIQLMLEINQKYNTIWPKASIQQKEAEKSKRYRNEGNQLYSRGKSTPDFLKALEKYSQSISFAPTSSTELSIAYANRSAVLHRMEKFEQCIQVIDRCLSLNYPDELKVKVLLRKMECLVAIGSPQTKKCYHQTRKWIEQTITNVDEQNKMKTKLEEVFKKSAKVKLENKNINIERLFKNLYFQKCNPQIAASSDALSLRYSETYGRHIVAAKDIRPGQIVAREAPYSIILSMKKRYSYCWKCLEALWNCVPCDYCTYVVYCSDKCKTEAWTEFHSIECNLLPHMQDFLYENGPPMLRLTILAVREFGDIQKLADEVREVDQCEDPRLKGFAKDGKFYSKKYRSIYSLSVAKIMDYENQRYLCILFYSAALLYILATESTFFGKQMNNWADLRNDKDVIFIGSLILRNAEILRTNGFSAKEITSKMDRKIGTEIHAFCSFLNHNCKPNITKCFYKNDTYLYANYPIRAGEQLFINYTPNYLNESKQTRQMKLKRYSFTCVCIACRENWPLYAQIPSLEEIIQIHGLKSLPKWNKFMQDMSVVADYMATPILQHVKSVEDIPLIFERLRNALEAQLEIVPLPCQEIEIIIRKMRFLFEALMIIYTENRFI